MFHKKIIILSTASLLLLTGFLNGCKNNAASSAAVSGSSASSTSSLSETENSVSPTPELSKSEKDDITTPELSKSEKDDIAAPVSSQSGQSDSASENERKIEGYVLREEGDIMYLDTVNAGARTYRDEGKDRAVAFDISSAQIDVPDNIRSAISVTVTYQVKDGKNIVSAVTSDGIELEPEYFSETDYEYCITGTIQTDDDSTLTLKDTEENVYSFKRSEIAGLDSSFLPGDFVAIHYKGEIHSPREVSITHM